MTPVREGSQSLLHPATTTRTKATARRIITKPRAFTASAQLKPIWGIRNRPQKAGRWRNATGRICNRSGDGHDQLTPRDEGEGTPLARKDGIARRSTAPSAGSATGQSTATVVALLLRHLHRSLLPHSEMPGQRQSTRPRQECRGVGTHATGLVKPTARPVPVDAASTK